MPLLRALIIEDHACMRLYMQAILRACGMDTIGARDGSCALRHASRDGIDLVLMDAETRGTDSLDFLGRIMNGAFGPKPPPVIVCSARLDDELYASRLESAGAGALLRKPFRPGDLIRAIRLAFKELEAAG